MDHGEAKPNTPIEEETESEKISRMLTESGILTSKEDEPPCEMDSQCVEFGVSKWEGKWYCHEHYQTAIMSNATINEYDNARMISLMRDHGIRATSIRLLYSFRGTHVFEYEFYGQLGIMKFQCLDPERERMRFDGVVKEYTIIGRGGMLNMTRELTYKTRLKDHSMIVNKWHDCTLRDWVNSNDDIDVDDVIAQMVTEVKRLHSAMFMHCSLSPDSFVIMGGKVRLASCVEASRYVSDQCYFFPNQPAPFSGNYMFSSINICECNSGTRNDDVESLFWIKLWLMHNDVMELIEKATTMTEVIYEKRSFMNSIGVKPRTTHSVDWSLLDSAK